MPLVDGTYYFSHEEDNWGRPAVILLHGAGGNHLYWPPEVRRLPGQRVYTLDLPGHGKSAGIASQSIGDYARRVLDFMDNIKTRKAIFVGHAMGGAIALYLGIHHPSRTLGLGLISTGARIRVPSSWVENTTSQATLPIAIQSMLDKSFSFQSDPRLKDAARQRMMETRPSVLHSDFLACDDFDESSSLGRIKSPTLIICGTDDQVTPFHLSQQLNSRIKNSMICQLDGAGHMAMQESPLQVANPLKLFLDGIDYQPGSTE